MITEALRRASDSVEDFRGDFDQMAVVMRSSWGENPTPPYLYTAELIADWFRYPGARRSLAPAIYHGSELVAFTVGHPRRVRAAGLERRILIATSLTVAPDQKGSGYGIVVWSELMRRAAAAGFDGVINYCVDGEAMDRMVPASCRLLALPLLRATSFSYLWCRLPERRTVGADPGPPPSAAQLVKAAAMLPEHPGLSRRWTEDEAEWQLSRVGAVSVTGGPDADPGVLTGYVISIADPVHTRCLVIEDVLWGGLAPEGRAALVGKLIATAASAGASAAVLPCLGYADLTPFGAWAFLPSQHTIHAYLTMWSEPVPDLPPERYYLDVF